ncbi:MAG: hypothetical protein ND895_17930 [Pyrinomonadaceae bacterium]|nr:hypothetical protein [Pyrinomonadaceae bacterium]
MKLILSTVMSLILGATELAESQTAAPVKPNWWVNLPSSPLKIDLVVGQGYGLSNFSEGSVVRYRTGCVVWKKEKLEITKRGPLRYTPVSMKPINLSRTPYETHSLLEGSGFTAERCNGRAKTAIIEVLFDDGSVWKAQR